MSASTRDELEHGRGAYAGRVWSEAHGSLVRVDEASGLSATDLELLAVAAYMLGRDDEWTRALERAHRLYAEAGDDVRAARAALWIGLHLALSGEVGPASGWLGRAQRMLDRRPEELAERGYLLLPVVFRHEAEGDFVTAASVAGEAVAIGERFDDRDLFALALHAQGHMLVKARRVPEGLALLDEAMVAVTAENISPIVTGLVYCGVILACQDVFEVRRAREWTAVLSSWCDDQPDLVAFTGRCLVHRAEIMQLGGSWSHALAEARRAGTRFGETGNQAAGLARYREAELLRLLGRFDEAEEAYLGASGLGWEPQPGLAQLRLAQGRGDAAAASIRRARAETSEPIKRVGLLPACVEIMLAIGETAEARSSYAELEDLAGDFESPLLSAIVASVKGALELAEGDVQAALVALRAALAAWEELEVPYEVARARELVGCACRALGDDDAAALELGAARSTFEKLGAAHDLARVDSLITSARATFGLSRRELEVLRLVARGKSNREIAAALVISEHTVARHVQNIFAKLDVSSRTAAGAFAFEHDLV